MSTEGTKWKEERPTTSATLTHLARQGALPLRAHLRGLTLIGETPSAASWHTFIWRMLLFLGIGFLVTGIFFFFAWNWDDMHRLAKLGLLQGLIVTAAGIAWQQRLNIVGKVALTAASLLIGAVMAVYGQQYQVKADAWQLFGVWTALMTGWVVINRFPPLWVIWQILLNMTIVLFGIQQELEPDILLGILFGINLVGMIVWEWAHGRFDNITTRWWIRLSGLVALISVFMPTVKWVANMFNSYYTPSPRELAANIVAFIAYGGLAAAILIVYRNRPRDLPLITLTLISVLIIATTGIATFSYEWLGIPEEVVLMVTGFSVLGMGAGLARYIHRLTNQEVSNEQ